MSFNILVLTRYARTGASSRLRFYQFIDDIKRNNKGVRFIEKPLFDDNYVDSLLVDKNMTISIFYAYMRRFFILLSARKYQCIWVEKEVFPFFPSIFEFILKKLKIKVVVDYDDATFHSYEYSSSPLVRYLLSSKIDKVMSYASCVICGNPYLADRALRNNNLVEMIPTVVNLNHYNILDNDKQEELFTVGWIGSPSTQKYILEIKASLIKFCRERKSKIVLVGAKKNILSHFPGDINVELREWTEDSEVGNIASFDVGIMPLTNGNWEKGKCGYKLIQYLACGIPALGSDVGVNREILENTKGGIIVNDWYKDLLYVHDNPEIRESLSASALKNLPNTYSMQKYSDKIYSILRY